MPVVPILKELGPLLPWNRRVVQGKMTKTTQKKSNDNARLVLTDTANQLVRPGIGGADDAVLRLARAWNVTSTEAMRRKDLLEALEGWEEFIDDSSENLTATKLSWGF